MKRVELVLPLSEYGNESLGYIEKDDGGVLPVIVIGGEQPGMRKAISDFVDQKRQAVLVSKEEADFDDDLRNTFLSILSEYKRSGEVSADHIHRNLKSVVNRHFNQEEVVDEEDANVEHVPYPPFGEDTENRPKGELRTGGPITDEGNEDPGTEQDPTRDMQVPDPNGDDAQKNQGQDPNDVDQGGGNNNPPRTKQEDDYEDYLNE